jgi:lipopolysaccharide/colanic/teichoic acid biosynthesis glycosyltransferase
MMGSVAKINAQFRELAGWSIACVLFVLVSPLMLGLAVLVLMIDGRPAFFLHRRVGRGCQPFWLLKLRTMRASPDRAVPQVTPPGDSRVTRFGRILRRYRLDELPQLLNVVSGDIALVGPRPEWIGYAERYPECAKTVLQIVPGIVDPGSLAFLLLEGELISSEAEPEAVYLEQVVPVRTAISIAYAARATPLSDLAVVLAGCVCALFPKWGWPLGLRLAGVKGSAARDQLRCMGKESDNEPERAQRVGG